VKTFVCKYLSLFIGMLISVAVIAAPTVEMKTNKGTILIELNAEKAPKTVENFLKYVNSGFYNGTVFHRVIPGFMIQGGGFLPDMGERKTSGEIQNEANNGLTNTRGTIAMARRNEPHSASSQFFINHANNAFLDHTGPQDGRTWGYAVFGRVVQGMDVVDRIASVTTGMRGMHRDVPVEPVIVESVKVVSKNK
jgi:cyclophilin family peptidyl-prolyl cis-trans isomerase